MLHPKSRSSASLAPTVVAAALIAGAAFASPASEPTGRLDPRLIQEVIQQHRGEVLECYQRALQGQPGFQQSLSARFIISRSGRVSSAQVPVESAPELGACIETKMLSWVFPPPSGDGAVTVTYPLRFTSSRSGP